MATTSLEHRALLLKIAAASIEHGLHHGEALPVLIKELAAELQAPRATFVTLHLDGNLQGCIGTLRAIRPFIHDVSRNAYAAAYDDPRGKVLHSDELRRIKIDISVLSPSEPITFKDEADLLRQIRPTIDGLILEDQGHVGTFLPSVWEQLPDKHDFLQHLKLKAGLSSNHWSATVSVKRYTTEKFSNHEG